jgi:excisionase family DNA binding protein
VKDNHGTSLPHLLKPSEASKLLGISRAKIYLFIREGVLEAVKVGSNYRVQTKSALKVYAEINSKVLKIEAA